MIFERTNHGQETESLYGFDGWARDQLDESTHFLIENMVCITASVFDHVCLNN